MKIILIGYEGSQKIVKASKYLTNKYLPDFCKIYLNYKGEVSGWAEYVAGFLKYLPDENIVFTLDDYLVADKMDIVKFADALCEMGDDVVCVKLCQSTPEEHDEYPVTTQYTIWNRVYLIWLLSKVNTPWEFEILGSAIFKKLDKKVLHRPCLEYFTNSSISSRWEGVRLDGLKQEDIDYIKENNLINGLI